ncbi:MAG TPA: respiratory nitrate reductase subunit gamma [Desulfuromonadales bacterium]|nr:respiratory nitrate reductase subunit gamma [Desulfuromonadales bacterium]
MTDQILFGIFPYVAVALAVAVGLYRYLFDRYSWSSQSSQFLESRTLYWGSVPWHYPILIVLLAHFLAFLFPSGWGELLGRPVRLYMLEVTGFALAACAFVGLLVLIFRRAGNDRVASVTRGVDWLVLLVLLLQMATGLYIALTLRWGSMWYLDTAAPWLWSLVKFDPQVQYLAVLPLSVKIHAVNAFVLIALFPFSRLAHVISIPLGYLGRPLQVVVWFRRRVQ